MALFEDTEPSLDGYWRAIILFGRNVASYKFALGLTNDTRKGRESEMWLNVLARRIANTAVDE